MGAIRIVETLAELDALEAPWNRLAEKTPSSFFSSFDYVRAAWVHFHNPGHRLFVLVRADGSSVTGLAPFYILRRRMWGIPYRMIRWIAAWEGDRPTLLAEGSRETLWVEVLRFLEEERPHRWEALELVEQPIEGPDGLGWSFLPRAGWHWEIERDAVDYCVSLAGSWDDYLKGLGANPRKQWRQKTRRLSTAEGGFALERVSGPDGIDEGFARYAAIERAGWKKGARLGAARDERCRAFYRDLLGRLAGKGQARLHFLTSGGRDLAGSISIAHADVTYHWHTAYLPSHATYSPGILLQAAMIQESFGESYREFDLLSLKEDGAPHRHKTEWATGRRETMRWVGYRLCPRLLLALLPKRLKRRLW